MGGFEIAAGKKGWENVPTFWVQHRSGRKFKGGVIYPAHSLLTDGKAPRSPNLGYLTLRSNHPFMKVIKGGI